VLFVCVHPPPKQVIRTEFPDAIVLEPKLVKERVFNITVPPTDSITSYRLYAMLVAEKEAHVVVERREEIGM